MVLKNNKKGIFFISLVIVMLSLLFITYAFSTAVRERAITKKRIETMNGFLFSTEEDLRRQAYITGFRIVFILEDYIIQTGSYTNNLNDNINELAFNGTLNGEQQPILIQATVPEIISTLNQRADKLNIELQFSNTSFTISQSDPWNVDAVLTSDIIMKDKNNIALWSKQEKIIAKIPVTNFEDPVYFIETGGLVTNKISKTPHPVFVQGSNVTNLLDHAVNSYYKTSTLAPSFLDRLQGINSQSLNGIESLVNIPELSNRGIAVQDKVVIDYIYFSTSSPQECTVQGAPSWLKIDVESIDEYNVTEIANC